MNQRSSYPESEAVCGIGFGILLTLVTCGIYGLFWQYRQLKALNAWHGRPEYDFAMWLLLSVVTCGIFAIYYEYKLARGINEIQRANSLPVDDDLALICVLLAVFGFGVGSFALRQNAINGFYGASFDF